MIDPINISNFNLTDEQLEENILFWVCAAGKNGVTAARTLNVFLQNLTLHWGDLAEGLTPFGLIGITDEYTLAGMMKAAGIGCYNQKARTFKELAHFEGLNLRTCTVADLETVRGIGPKTSRAFVVHTREGQKFAIIDTHLLKYLKHLGHDVPKSTPSKKKYAEIEKIYLEICERNQVEPYELDLAIWNHYRQRPNAHFDLVSWKATRGIS